MRTASFLKRLLNDCIGKIRTGLIKNITKNADLMVPNFLPPNFAALIPFLIPSREVDGLGVGVVPAFCSGILLRRTAALNAQGEPQMCHCGAWRNPQSGIQIEKRVD